jgi:diphthamide synthase (EF-2-diphthine--ammonia ligase)
MRELDAQAAAIGLPVDKVFVSMHGGNDEYERAMSACLGAQQARGVSACAFGDIFLEDLRRWREANLARIGTRGLFPLWGRDTRDLVGDFLGQGFAAMICCANAAYLGREARRPPARR